MNIENMIKCIQIKIMRGTSSVILFNLMPSTVPVIIFSELTLPNWLSYKCNLLNRFCWWCDCISKIYVYINPVFIRFILLDFRCEDVLTNWEQVCWMLEINSVTYNTHMLYHEENAWHINTIDSINNKGLAWIFYEKFIIILEYNNIYYYILNKTG